MTDSIGLMKKMLGSEIEGKSEKKQCTKDKHDALAEVHRVHNKIEDILKHARRQDQQIHDLEEHMTRKVDTDEIQEFKRLIAILPTNEQVTKMKRDMDTNITKFRADNDRFASEFTA